MSMCNDAVEAVSVEDRVLDAAADCVLAMGFDRVTLTEIAREGVRQTLPATFMRCSTMPRVCCTGSDLRRPCQHSCGAWRG